MKPPKSKMSKGDSDTPEGDSDMSSGAEILPLRPPRPCPNCGKLSVRAYYPFCSKRCADLDLHRWLSGAYSIPAVEAEPAGEGEENEEGGG